MTRFYIPLLVLVLLSGCTGHGAPVAGLPCKPPVVIMKKSEPLPDLKLGTMREMYNTMLQDAEQFNQLRDKHSNLVDWVDAHCQN